MQLPVAQEVNGDDHFSRKEEGQIEGTDHRMKGKASSVAQRQRREPVQRSRAEEEKAYGRTFEGCGQQSDYEVTTKLGEGTFGFVLITFLLFSGHAFLTFFLREVHKAIQKSSGKVMALKRILMHNEKEGMPVTALREIKILKSLKHPCIVEIVDMFVVRSESIFFYTCCVF
jgi:serine/threonine-protein kinase BUR1